MGKLWKPVTIFHNGVEKVGLISDHWLYFASGDQWYKVNLNKYDIPLDLPSYTFNGVAITKLSDEELKARKKLRRQARRAREKAEEEED